MKRDWYGEYLAACSGADRPSLLLHVCCAPCMSAGIEHLAGHFRVTAYFYNPNITLRSEYRRRLDAVVKLTDALGLGIAVKDGGYDPPAYGRAVGADKGGREGGSKCRKCISARLDAAAAKCAELGCEYVATTLTASPLKDADFINETGAECAAKHGVKWLPTDFKKNGGCVRTKRLCSAFGIYRQHYCGCTPDRLVVAVTGGIASGKSEFTRILASLGAHTIDADAVTRELQTPGHGIYGDIARAFPDCVRDGMLDRKKLAAAVFSDGEKRRLLESIVHPAVIAEIRGRASHSDAPVTVIEIPLLFESGTQDIADVIVNVSAPDGLRRRRAAERSGMSAEMFGKVAGAQWTDEMRRSASDVTVANDGGRDSLESRARELYAQWLKLTGR